MTNRKISFLLLTCSLFVFAACNKDKNDKQDTIQFNGITATDIYAMKITTDPSDWQLHDQWSDKEHALLGKPLPAMTGNPVSALIGYPNPCANKCSIYQMDRKTGSQLQYCIVDRHYKVLLQGLDTGFNTSVDVAALGITDTVRMYYRIVRNDSAAYGHGDIVIFK